MMFRFSLLLAVAATLCLVVAQDVEPVVDCDTLMTDLPDCTDMIFEVCTDGTPASCAATVSATQVEATTNSTNGTAVEEPCEKFVCFENGTYTSMEDDMAAPSVEDDAAVEGNGTSIEDDAQGASLEDDTNGTATGASGTSAAPLVTAAAGSVLAVVAAGLSLLM